VISPIVGSSSFSALRAAAAAPASSAASSSPSAPSAARSADFPPLRWFAAGGVPGVPGAASFVRGPRWNGPRYAHSAASRARAAPLSVLAHADWFRAGGLLLLRGSRAKWADVVHLGLDPVITYTLQYMLTGMTGSLGQAAGFGIARPLGCNF
jgi:hypothetical protein